MGTDQAALYDAFRRIVFIDNNGTIMNAPQRNEAMFPFDNSYARLPDRFFERLAPKPVPAPKLIRVNHDLANQLGLDPQKLVSSDGVATLAGNRIAEGSEPIAMAYAGHQFGGWSPQLGDGRAMLLGEVIDRDGVRRDIQLKGSGPTSFSRMGDGRAWLGPVLREYIVSEAMAALGVPTTRALAAVATGDVVVREQMFPGAVLTRVARSHIRVGTFQFFAARRDVEGLRLLMDHVISRHYPDAAGAKNPALALLQAVMERQAFLVAQWMHIGFIHGVMNTDNMSVAGETIDYGPCAFMDRYHPETVFSSIDQHGRYAYRNQPRIAHWNLACLAQSLMPLVSDDEDEAVKMGQEALNRFPELYETAYLSGMNKKIGLEEEQEGDDALAVDLLARMAENHADFTLTFRALCEIADAGGDEKDLPQRDAPARDLFINPISFDAWAVEWRKRLALDNRSADERKAAMRAVNPAFIPRNHRVEEAIQAALGDDFKPFEDLVTVLANPYAEQPDFSRLAKPPTPDQVVRETFCGT